MKKIIFLIVLLVFLIVPAVSATWTYNTPIYQGQNFVWSGGDGTLCMGTVNQGCGAIIGGASGSVTMAQLENDWYYYSGGQTPYDGCQAWLFPYYGDYNIGKITLYPNTPAPPVASFSGSPSSGNSPLNVSFTDSSTNTPTSWSWTFGDGGSSTSQNPYHTYSSAGSYSVNLTVTNSGGSNSLVKTNYITVTTAVPVASFSGSPTSGTFPLTVSFTDTSTYSPTSWSWLFGDGSSSTSQNPSHTYSAAGSYTVNHSATNAEGTSWKNITSYITASTPVSIASFTYSPSSGVPPLNVNFTDTSTNTPTSWLWKFGDGITSILESPLHTYSKAGTYTINFEACNGGGCSWFNSSVVVLSGVVYPTTFHVIDSQYGTAIPDASVQVYEEGSTNPTISGSTDGEGYYPYDPGLDYGAYTYFVNANGYTSITNQSFQVNGAQTITVPLVYTGATPTPTPTATPNECGDTLYTTNGVVDYQAWAFMGIVFGCPSVTDSAGNSVSSDIYGGMCNYLLYENMAPYYTTVSGNAEQICVLSGNYPNPTPTPTLGQGQPVPTQGPPPSPTPVPTWDPVLQNLVMYTVTNSSGYPQAGVAVQQWNAATGYQAAGGFTNASGTINFLMNAGSYTYKVGGNFFATGGSYTTTTGTYTIGGSIIQIPVVVNTLANLQTSYPLIFNAFFSNSDIPVTDAAIAVYANGSSSPMVTGTTDDNGNTLQMWVPVGNYTWQATATGMSSASGGLFVNGAMTIPVPMNSLVTQGPTLPTGYETTFETEDSYSGKLIPGVQVVVYWEGQTTFAQGMTDSAGSLMKLLPVDQYTYSVAVPGYVTQVNVPLTVSGAQTIIVHMVPVVTPTPTQTFSPGNSTPGTYITLSRSDQVAQGQQGINVWLGVLPAASMMVLVAVILWIVDYRKKKGGSI